MSRDTQKTLGLKTKLKVEKAVASRKRGISADDISKKTGVKPATVRLHLLKLKKAGSISSTKEGRTVLYHPSGSAALANISAILDKNAVSP